MMIKLAYFDRNQLHEQVIPVAPNNNRETDDQIVVRAERWAKELTDCNVVYRVLRYR